MILNAFYHVTVTVVDGAGGSDAIGVTIEVNNRTEAPSAPARPTVRATEKSSTKPRRELGSAPANTAVPPSPAMTCSTARAPSPFSTNGVTDHRHGRPSFRVPVTMMVIVRLHDAHNCGSAPTTPPTRCGCGRTNGERAIAPGREPAMGRTNRANHDPIFDRKTRHRRTGSGAQLRLHRSRGVIDENPRSGRVCREGIR